jgi:transcriptional regulator with XRE-family HTH domain
VFISDAEREVEMPLVGSTVVRRQLGRHLRQLRHCAGKTEADVEEANLASRVKLWRIETGKVAVKIGDVRGLCWLYGADTKTTDTLSMLALGSREHDWWEDYGQDWFSLHLGLEGIADELRTYNTELVPDLLQTPDYAVALCRAIRPDGPDEFHRSQVTLQAERQQRLLTRVPSQRLIAVLGAAALTRPVGGAAVMSEQVACLRELNRRDHIDIRVLPWEAGAHPALRVSAFAILDFHHIDDPSVVHAETHTGARYLEKPAELAEYRRVFDLVYRKTTPIESFRP